jgi:hypothetical protein
MPVHKFHPLFVASRFGELPPKSCQFSKPAQLPAREIAIEQRRKQGVVLKRTPKIGLILKRPYVPLHGVNRNAFALGNVSAGSTQPASRINCSHDFLAQTSSFHNAGRWPTSVAGRKSRRHSAFPAGSPLHASSRLGLTPGGGVRRFLLLPLFSLEFLVLTL